MDRNVEVTGYVVGYALTSDPEDRVTDDDDGTDASDRMETVPGLIPRTNYTFDVAAFHFDFDNRVLLIGPVTAEIVVTAISPGNDCTCRNVPHGTSYSGLHLGGFP